MCLSKLGQIVGNTFFGVVAYCTKKWDQEIKWKPTDQTEVEYGATIGAGGLVADLVKGDGAITYYPVVGSVLSPGRHTLRVDAAETTVYNSASHQIEIIVRAGQQVTWPSLIDPVPFHTKVGEGPLKATAEPLLSSAQEFHPTDDGKCQSDPRWKPLWQRLAESTEYRSHRVRQFQYLISSLNGANRIENII